jgi:hypothetical protein
MVYQVEVVRGKGKRPEKLEIELSRIERQQLRLVRWVERHTHHPRALVRHGRRTKIIPMSAVL